MDGGEDVLRALRALLLKVFMLIGGWQCSEYINALTASIMLWGHYNNTLRLEQFRTSFGRRACEIPSELDKFEHNSSARRRK